MSDELYDEYIVVGQTAWMNEGGFGINYAWDGERFGTMQEAIKHGWTLRESDDFNIGIIRGNKLTWFGWVDEEMDDDKSQVAAAIGLEAAP